MKIAAVTRRDVLRWLGTAAISASLPGCIRSARCNSGRNYPLRAEDRFWDSYQRAFLRLLPQGGMILVDEGGNYTPSEGMGHAMFFAAERKDLGTFDSLVQGLSNFRKTNGLLRWKINPDGSFSPEGENLNCATETEQNVANAFLLAYEGTGQTQYLDMGLALLRDVWQNATILFQGRRLLLPTDQVNRYWPLVLNDPGTLCEPGNDGLICSEPVQSAVWSPSYFSPEHAVRFARHDTNAGHDWNRLVADWYEIMNLVLDAATQEPERFGIVDVNPMPDFVKLASEGTSGIMVEDLHPELGTGEGEWSADIIRIPLYVGIHDDPRARAFLKRFFAVMRSQGFRGPDDVSVGRHARIFSSLTTAAIGCYGVGLQAIGEDVTEYRNSMCMDENGLFSSGFFQGPRYYRDTISYYAWLVLNNRFPF